MSLDALGSEDKVRLGEIVERCARMKMDIKEQNDAIKDLVANVAEETDVDKKTINSLIKFETNAMIDANKGTLSLAKEALDDVEELAHVLGL